MLDPPFPSATALPVTVDRLHSILLGAAVGAAPGADTASPGGEEESEEDDVPPVRRPLGRGTVVEIVRGGFGVGFPGLDLALDGGDGVVVPASVTTLRRTSSPVGIDD